MFLLKHIIDTIFQYSKLDKIETVGLRVKTITKEIEFVREKSSTFLQSFLSRIDEQHFLNFQDNLFLSEIKEQFEILVINSDKGLARIFNVAFKDMEHDLESLFKVNIFLKIFPKIILFKISACFHVW